MAKTSSLSTQGAAPSLSESSLPSRETAPGAVPLPAGTEPVPFSPPAPDEVPQRCVPPQKAPERRVSERKTVEKPETETVKPAEVVRVEPEHERVRSGCW